jgi:hypothetical protein
MNDNSTPTDVLSDNAQRKAARRKLLWWPVAILLGGIGGYVGWSSAHDTVTAMLGAGLGLLFGFLLATGSARGCGT